MVMVAMVTVAMAALAMVPVICLHLSDMGKADQV